MAFGYSINCSPVLTCTCRPLPSSSLSAMSSPLNSRCTASTSRLCTSTVERIVRHEIPSRSPPSIATCANWKTVCSTISTLLKSSPATQLKPSESQRLAALHKTSSQSTGVDQSLVITPRLRISVRRNDTRMRSHRLSFSQPGTCSKPRTFSILRPRRVRRLRLLEATP
jgi:hypothetical protein